MNNFEPKCSSFSQHQRKSYLELTQFVQKWEQKNFTKIQLRNMNVAQHGEVHDYMNINKIKVQLQTRQGEIDGPPQINRNFTSRVI